MNEEELAQIQAILMQHGYLYKEHLGSGSFSNVFLCQSSKYNQQFAIKRAIKHKISVYEYKTLISLNHPNIITLYDAFEDDSSQYLVMEYCTNGTLREKVNLSYEMFVNYAKQILDAIDYCHSNNIAHRDIKPDNIFIDSYNHIKLADFGFARQFDDKSKSTEKCGSMNFISPEMIQCQEMDPFKTDIWALGITFFFVVTGLYPFKGNSREVLKEAILYGDLDYSKCNVDQRIRFLIGKMTAKNPASRLSADKLLKLPMFASINPRKSLLYPLKGRRNSYTIGINSQSNFNLLKSSTFDKNQLNNENKNEEDKKSVQLVDIHTYQSINMHPRMGSHYPFKPP